MYIVTEDSLPLLEDKYILLELDTLVDPESLQKKRFYCVVDSCSLQDMTILEKQIQAHQQMMHQYKKQNWEYCRQACVVLKGKWNGILDSFYQTLIERIDKINMQSHAPNLDILSQ